MPEKQAHTHQKQRKYERINGSESESKATRNMLAFRHQALRKPLYNVCVSSFSASRQRALPSTPRRQRMVRSTPATAAAHARSKRVETAEAKARVQPRLSARMVCLA